MVLAQAKEDVCTFLYNFFKTFLYKNVEVVCVMLQLGLLAGVSVL